MTVENRISKALELRGMKQIELAEKTGISKGTINNWIKNKYQPKQKSLIVLAKALDVSELWLAGYDAPQDRAPEQKKNDTLVEVVAKLRRDNDLFNSVVKLTKLTDEQKETVYRVLAAFVNE